MSHSILSTVKYYGHTSETFIHHLITTLQLQIMQIVARFGEGYFIHLKHICYYVDPITGRAIFISWK